MSELSTLARPYAEAVFRMAQGENDLAGWSSRVQSLALIVSDAQVARLIADPAVPADRVAGLIIEVAGADLGERGGNFVKVLAENDRLSVLPEIGAQFETLKANAEGTLEAHDHQRAGTDAGADRRSGGRAQGQVQPRSERAGGG